MKRLVAIAAFGMIVTPAFAVECPTPGEPCKVLYLTAQEEKLLMGQNGVLDTAAQARSLDLGQFAVYFKTRIVGSPQGEVAPVKPSQTNSVPQPSATPAASDKVQDKPPLDNPK